MFSTATNDLEADGFVFVDDDVNEAVDIDLAEAPKTASTNTNPA